MSQNATALVPIKMSKTPFEWMNLPMTRTTLTASVIALGCIASLAGMAPNAASASVTATVGDPAHPDQLAPAIESAYQSGARRIVIRPGYYLLPNVGHTAITLKGWNDATLSAAGVTLILTDLAWMHDCIDLENCTNVTVNGALLSQNTVTSYQGRVIAIGKDTDGKPYCDWRPDTGYPTPPNVEKGFLGGDVNVVDSHTRLLKVGCGDFYGVKDEPLPDGTFRAHMGGNIAVGDWFVGRYGNAPFKVYVNNSHNCTIKNVTMMRNGFAPLREDNGGGNHYLHCVWALGPRPGGAHEAAIVTNAADGMHMTGSSPGPDIEDCQFQGVFLDDCIAIHGGFQTVKSVSGNSLTLIGGVGGVKSGQTVRISDQKGYFAEPMVTAVKDNGDNTTTVTLDRDYSVPIGSKLSNPLADGAGYKIIHCHLGCTRSRGILAKADNGLIQGNVLENCGMSAVSLGPEYYWGEADYVHNVTVDDNIIRNDGGASYGGAAILIHGDGAVGNKNIVIRRNKMSNNFQGDMDIQWVNGVTITNNLLTAPQSLLPGAKTYPAIQLANCINIDLKSNTVYNALGYSKPFIAVGANVTAVTHNDSSGVRTGAKAP